MTNPTVCAVMLTRDRPELAAKAVECFRRQTYENKRLLIWNTSDGVGTSLLFNKQRPNESEVFCSAASRAFPIGTLRNYANGYYSNAEILIHFDDDDWSHPNRITEQVALLQASGADVVGFNEMLFWREGKRLTTSESLAVYLHDGMTSMRLPGEAWLYKAAAGLTPALGTSLCYWRKTWERKPFNPALPKAGGGMSEETEFLRGLKCEAVSAMGPCGIECFKHPTVKRVPYYEPRMIARIHGSNFGKYDIENQIERGSNAKPGEGWTRATEWDNRVREILG